MSIRTLLMPVVSEWLLSRPRLLRARARAEKQRLKKGLPHELLYFHQTDDPYSHLALQALAPLLERYPLQLRVLLVSPPADNAAPDRERLVAYSRVDAQLLAQEQGLHYRDPGHQPGANAVALTGLALQALIDAGTLAQEGPACSARLWSDASLDTQPVTQADRGALAKALQEGDRLRRKLGHYLGATFFYAGEWYWGIDRLHHLEERLQELGAWNGHDRPSKPLYPPDEALGGEQPLASAPELDFFFSLRSPYSAIVAPRVFALARRTGARLRLRFVLPMVMRGLAVPREKRMYISLDAAREAHRRGIPFGRLNDPVGRPAERGLALIPWAERLGRGQEYVLAFMHAVWAEGVDAGSETGLRRIVEASGLPWAQAHLALQDNAWRAEAEANRQALLGLGLWGVPSFRVGSLAVWGQDRLGRVQKALQDTDRQEMFR
jgi:2-hydroxychromene-2-carboxylate isomerase